MIKIVTIFGLISKYGLILSFKCIHLDIHLLAGGESLPEKVAATCLAFSLGERNLTPCHLLPDSHHLLLLLQLTEPLHPFRSHQLWNKLQQEQASAILKETNPKSYFQKLIYFIESQLWGAHLAVSDLCSQYFSQPLSRWNATDLDQQHGGKQNHEKQLHLRANHLHLTSLTPSAPGFLFNTSYVQNSRYKKFPSPINKPLITVYVGGVEVINRLLHPQILLILKPTKGCDWWREMAARERGGVCWRVCTEVTG